MKNLFTFSLLFSVSFSCFGQLKDFDLRDQILGDYERQALTVTLGTTGSNHSSSFAQNSSNTQYSNFNFQPNLYLGYSIIQNSRSSQFNFNSNTFLQGNWSKNGEDESTFNALDFVNFTNVSKLFYNKKNQFFGLGGSTRISYDSRENIQKGISSKTVDNYLGITFTPSIGIGRIENVTDAWRAYRMLEDFEKFGVLSREPSMEEIRKFAELNTTRVRGIRMFDRRYKRIADIQALADYLLESGLVNNENGRFYNSLYDMWLYGANGLRNTGQRWQLSFPLTIVRRSNKSPNNDFFALSGEFEVALEYINNKPINLEWQFDWSGSITGGYDRFDLLEDSNETYYLRPEVRAALGYYPNTRTNIDIGSAINYRLEDWEQLDHLPKNVNWLSFDLFANMYYYFSPQTRMEARISFSDDYLPNYFNCNSRIYGSSYTVGDDYRNAHCNRLSYQLRFSHSFF